MTDTNQAKRQRRRANAAKRRISVDLTKFEFGKEHRLSPGRTSIIQRPALTDEILRAKAPAKRPKRPVRTVAQPRAGQQAVCDARSPNNAPRPVLRGPRGRPDEAVALLVQS